MQSRQKTEVKLADLVQGLDVSIQGDSERLIRGVCPIQQSQPGHLTFLTNALYRKHLDGTQAAAVVLSPADAKDCPTTAIISHNPYYAYAKMAAFFLDATSNSSGIHPSAVIGQDCEIDPSASIGPTCVLGDGVKIGARVALGAGCIIGNHVTIGADTQFDARVTIYAHVRIGQRTRIASGVVIGCDGFGFANEKRAWHKVPQLGSVEIGDDVDIGANTTIDRGAIENTIIENGVKLDNLIQIGHNVRIGENTIMAGCAGVAGSTVIGKNCMIGGATCVNGHITLVDNVMVTGMSSVTKSILEPGIYSSGIVGMVPNHEFRKNNARFYRLENLMQRVKQLEAVIKKFVPKETTE